MKLAEMRVGTGGAEENKGLLLSEAVSLDILVGSVGRERELIRLFVLR